MTPSTSTTLSRLAAGISGSADPARAAERVCAQCAEGLGAGSVDLAMLFVSPHHVANLGAIAAAVRSELRVDCLVGVSGESVLGGRTELERAPGVSLLAARLPGAMLAPFTAEDLSPFEESPEGMAKLGRAIGAGDDLRATFLFADPFSVPIMGLVPVLNRAKGSAPLIGGVASGATSPGGNAMVLDETVHRTGLVGVSLKGPVRVDTVVSQGCRGFGPNLVVTKSKKNIILELSGRPALHAVRDAVEELPEEDKKLLEKGLFIGRVINEYKERFGRDDFLIRNVVGIDENHNAVAVSDFLRIGQTVRLHLRDARTADEDLAMLLDAQQLRDPPLGGLLITCNGRGSRLFDSPHHDVEAIARAFAPGRGGEDLAKGGKEIDPEGPTLPIAGFFAAGEIGPVGGESFIHGHTACLALFRPAR